MHVRSPRVIALLMVLGLSAAAPISAQQFGFGPRPDYDIIVPRFADAESPGSSPRSTRCWP